MRHHHHIIACCVELADLKSNDLTTIKTALCQINPPIIVERIDKALLVVAVAFGTINVVGGFLVTDRMLEMFKREDAPR